MIIIGPNGRVRMQDPKGFLRDGRPRTYSPSAGLVPLLSRGTLAATYEAMFRSQPWLYTVVNKLTRGIARNPWKTYRNRDPDGQVRERLRDHPVSALLGKPYPGGSSYSLKEAITGSMYVHGNALIYKARPGPGQPPTELWPLPWRHIETRMGPSGLVADHYIFHGEHERLTIHPEDVIHYRLYGLGTGVGISPIEALRRTLAIEDAAQMWTAQTFRNQATVSGAFVAKGKLRDATVGALRAQLDSLYGGVENAGRFAVLDSDMTFTPVQHSAADTALVEQRKLTREEVAAAYDVSPVVIGILDRATFSNVTEQRRMHYVDTIGPPCESIAETTQAQLIDLEPSFAGVFTEFDLSAVLQGDPERRSQSYQRWIQGVYTPDELRALENLEPQGGEAGRLWMPANLLPVGVTRDEIEARSRLLEAHARVLSLTNPDQPLDPEPVPGDIDPTVDA